MKTNSTFLLALCATLSSAALASLTSCTSTASVPQASGSAVVTQATSTKAAGRGTVLLNAADMKRLKGQGNLYPNLVKEGTAKLDYVAKPVAIFAPEPHYNDKGVNPSANNDKQLALDAEAAYRTALAYVLTNDVRYAATSQRIIDAWAGTLKQVTTEQGKAGINFSLPYMIIAASWVREANNWNSSTFDAFLPAVVIPNASSHRTNNHGLWGTLLEASAAAYLGDDALLTKARTNWQTVLRGEVEADGSMPQETERSNTNNWRGGPDKGIKGIAYTHYALLPASMTAKIFADQGQPAWDSEGGQMLKKAFDKAAAWTLKPETFPFYASNNGQLMGVDNAPYFPLLLKYYPNAEAEAVVKQGKLGGDGFRLLELFGQ